MSASEDQSRNEGLEPALREAIEQRRRDPEFMARMRRRIEDDRELLERLAD